MSGYPSIRHSDRYRGYSIRELTIGKVLAQRVERNGDKVFLTCLADGRRYTYRDLDRASNRLANGLQAHGVDAGSHVAILMENSPEQLLSFFAIGKIRGVSIPINAASRGDLLRYFLVQSDSTAIFIGARYLERVIALGPALAKTLRLVVVVPDGTALPPAEHHGDWRCIDIASLMAAGDEIPPRIESSFRDLAMIMYTSGTTGPSKGCSFSQARTFLWGMSHSEALGYRASDIFYVCMPLFHVSALLGSTYNALSADASVVLARGFSASRFWDDVRQSGATVGNMQGSMANILWGRPPSPDDGNHKLRMCQVSPCPEFALNFEERFKMRFVSGYGLTDYGSTHAFTLSDPIWKLGSAGRTRRGVEARIVDEDDFDVQTGEVGELILRDNNPWGAGEGYYKMPEATVESMRNGWFHTGDKARIDEDGYMWFVGRSKDTIRRRGENISAFEVELVVRKHSAVEDAAAFPIRSELGEDDVAVAVVLRSGHSLSEIELIQYCAAEMAYFMVPRYVRWVPDLPRTLSHKVQKFKLREETEADLSSLWDRDAAGVVLRR